MAEILLARAILGSQALVGSPLLAMARRQAQVLDLFGSGLFAVAFGGRDWRGLVKWCVVHRLRLGLLRAHRREKREVGGAIVDLHIVDCEALGLPVLLGLHRKIAGGLAWLQLRVDFQRKLDLDWSCHVDGDNG